MRRGSISLNTDDPVEYLSLCRPKFGEAAYPAMLKFAEEAAANVRVRPYEPAI